MTAPNPRLACMASFLVVVTLSSASADVPGSSKAVQLQLDAARKQQIAAEKKVALTKAAADITKKRIADLQKQLKETQQRAETEVKAFEAAEKERGARSKQVAALAEQLKKHQHADALLAAAAAAQEQKDKAAAQHSALNAALAGAKTRLFSQQQRYAAAEKALKTTQAELPKKLEELTKVRATYDAAGREVDTIRLNLSDARKLVETRKAAVQPEVSRALKAKAALTQVTASIQSLEGSLATLKSAAQTAGTSPDDAGSELSKSIAAVRPLQKRASDLVAAAQARVAAAQKQTAEAETALRAVQDRLRTQQDKFAEQSRSHFRLQLAVADLQNAEKLHQHHMADAKAQQEQEAAKQKQLAPQIAAAAAEVEKLQAAYVSKQQTAEAELESLGRFVSFSRHVAPIFAKRCVACHNTRTAGGRLNMDSFAALLKGGESGPAFDLHDAENSLLSAMIEDGSMPKDADPLAKEEIALIRKWIDVGAPLDAGVVATAELFQVMPEIPQPLPPKTYRVPIPVTATAFNADASVLASSGYHEILLWNTEDGSLLRRITNVAERVYDLEFSKDGAQLIVAAGTPGQLGEVKLFRTADGTHQKTLVRTKDAIFAAAWSPDGSQVAAGGADRVVYVAEAASGKTIQRIEDHADWVMDVNWSPDGKDLVSASRDKTSKVFEVATGRSRVTFNGHGNAVYSAAFLADGKSIVSAGSDRQARVWNLADAKEVRKIGGFGSDIFRIAVTPDNHLFTASADRNAREHNLADGKAIRTFAGHKDWVYTLCYNPTKKLIATGSYDGEIRVWNSEDGSVATSFIAIPKAGDTAAVAAAEQ